MEIKELDFFRAFVRMCNDGWEQRWHERNGGNLTYRLSERERKKAEAFSLTAPGAWKSIGVSIPILAGEWFMATGSGKYFRHVRRDPEDSLAIIELDEAGKQYRIRWGLTDGGRPTSELPAHLMNHARKKQVSGDEYRVIYHSHPANLIAMTFLLPPDDEIFTKTLWGMISECVVVFPDGVGVLPWMVPGSRAIAEATGAMMETYDVVIWTQHGVFCAGSDFDTAFGLTHTVEKAAEIYVKVRAAGGDISRAISMENIHKLEKAFLIKANDSFGRTSVSQITGDDGKYFRSHEMDK